MVRALVGAAHPGPSAAVTVVAVLLAVGVGLAPDTTAILALAVLAGQLSVGWSNDALDAERDTVTGRRDKPAAQRRIGRDVLLRAAWAAALVTLGLSAALGLAAGAAHLLLPAAGWFYNLGLKATWFSGAAYAVGFAGLPAAAYLALPGTPNPPVWAPVAGALLGVAAHVANVLPDLADDVATGIRGLPHRLGPSRALLLMATVLVAAAGVSALGPPGPPSPVGAAGVVLVLVGSACAVRRGWRRPDSPAAFRTVVAVALLTVVLFVVAA